MPNERFEKDPRLRGPRALAGGRFFEADPKERQDAVDNKKVGKKGRALELPERAGKRATLIERDNPDEFLEFHWDPTSYNISKTGKWNSEGVEGGTDIFNWSGSSPTAITFDAFFDEVDIRHKHQRTVEDSMAWLFNRLRSRDKKFAAPRFGRYSRRLEKWLNVRDPESRAPPPIMVFFGLRDGFECVLLSARIKTVFQAPPFPFDAAEQAAEIARTFPGDSRIATLQRNFELAGITSRGYALRRTVVSIELKEYVNAPAT